MWEYENILIARTEDEVVICNLETDNTSYSYVHNGYNEILYSSGGILGPHSGFAYNG